MVAGDHFDGHAGGRALADGIDGLGPRRINQADESDKDEPALDVAESQLLLPFLRAFRGDRQNALSARRHLVDARMPACAIERTLLSSEVLFPEAQFEQPLRGALDEDVANPFMVVMQRRHEAMLRLEGNLIRARQLERQLLQIDAAFHGGGEQGAFGGIALDAPRAVLLAQHGVIAERKGAQSRGQVSVLAHHDILAIVRETAMRIVS